ncbi:ROK family protein [Pontibacter sp. CAU 1760]
MDDGKVIGVDIGGSHITAAVVDLEKQAMVPGTLYRAEVNSEGSVAQVLDTWCAVINQAQATLPGTAVKLGVSMPGPFNYEEGICLFQNQNKYDCLYGLNVKQLLADRLQCGRDSIRMANDASCFLRGEVFGGAAKAATSAIGLTLGTGLGSATLQQGIAADADLWRSPFKDGIAEEYLSTRAFVAAYKKLSGREVADVKALAALYPQDAKAQEVFYAFGEDLALFLAPFVLKQAPDVVIIGGNIAKAWDFFVPATLQHLAGMGISVPLQQAILAEEAALVGAASHWHEKAPPKPHEAASPLGTKLT